MTRLDRAYLNLNRFCGVGYRGMNPKDDFDVVAYDRLKAEYEAAKKEALEASNLITTL